MGGPNVRAYRTTPVVVSYHWSPMRTESAGLVGAVACTKFAPTDQLYRVSLVVNGVTEMTSVLLTSVAALSVTRKVNDRFTTAVVGVPLNVAVPAVKVRPVGSVPAVCAHVY